MNNDTPTPKTDVLIDRMHVRHKKDESFTREDRYKAMVKHARNLERIAAKLAEQLDGYRNCAYGKQETREMFMLRLQKTDAAIAEWEAMKEGK